MQHQEEWGKRNHKVDSFFKRTLSPEQYSKIRFFEPCILVSKEESKVFRYVLLSGESLYLTEYPPKKLHGFLKLRDVIGLELVQELPEFLQSEVGQNVEHIRIYFKKKRWAQLADALSDSLPNVHLAAAAKLDTEEAASPATARRRRYSQGRRYSLNGDDAPDPKKLTKDLPAQIAEEPAPSPAGGFLAPPMLSGSSRSPSQQLLHGMHQRAQSEDSGMGNSFSALSVADLGGLSQSSRQSSANNLFAPGINLNGSGHGSMMSVAPLMRTKSSSGLKAQDSVEKEKGLSSKTSPRQRRGREDDVSSVNIYTLSSDSKLLLHLESALQNCIMRLTEQLDMEYLAQAEAAKKTAGHTEQQTMLFRQMASEILLSQTLEDSFDLIHELSVAGEHNMTVKKLFWETPDLYVHVLRQLALYLPSSPSGSGTPPTTPRPTTPRGGAQPTSPRGPKPSSEHCRADELEYALVILELLSNMMKEGEVVYARTLILTASRPCSLVDLLTCIVADPDRTKAGLSKGRGGRPEEDTGEIDRLVREITDAALRLFFYLVTVTQQALSGDRDLRKYSPAWLIRVMDGSGASGTNTGGAGASLSLSLSSSASFFSGVTSRDFRSRFLPRMMGRLMEYLAPTCPPLEPRDAVLMFQYFAFMHTLLKHGGDLGTHFKSAFIEEFRYFVRNPAFKRKLGDPYPINERTLFLVDQMLKLLRL
eukprot:Opistho-2@49431